ncbi:MAG TPA: PSD1 and planctomycete cytochrome C domain-containing protein, partial [Verrucomicrobiae bacterium]|nr:PSD1 and planctomycete cytochrome C domain-containing protein [Verrucomicrobiae bacterium]
MVCSQFKPVWLLSVFTAVLSAGPFADGPPDPAAIEFFESKIRPALAEHCYSCHSAKAEKLKGGLFLDTREGLLKGGDTGPALAPGDPDKSLLIKAVRYLDENLQMPPKGKKLSSAQIADLEAWVKMGAPDPRTGNSPAVADRDAKRKNHWAFQPIHMPALPEVKRPGWIRNGIDAFVLARLETNNMSASAPAERRTLIRRATFDLLGLPPTPEEVESFASDTSEKAWENVVDRLLASPQYGERWARHWLDVARYADTKGYVFEEERRYPYSYTYRDYVIRAFNEDLPFDRFIVEQIAADLLPLGEDKRPLAAMGFLTLGRRFLNNQPDIIDDRIDVMTRGLMGLTVACARCHDHKFDPIPTKDYYSMYGVLASSSEPREKPLLGTAALPKEYPAYEAERKKRQEELDLFRATKYAEVLADLRAKASDYMLAATEAEKLEDKSKIDNLAKERKLHPIAVRRWMSFLEERRKLENDPIFAPWFAFARLTNYVADAKPLASRFHDNESSPSINPIVAKAFGAEPPNSLPEVAQLYKKLFSEIEDAWVAAQKGKTEKLASEEQESLRQVLYADSSPGKLADGEIPRLFDVPAAQKNRALQRKLEELDAVHPGSPPRGMVLKENSEPAKARVFVRGSQFNPGAEVPRQFLELIAGPDRKPFQNGSGRLEMAEAIASKENPLTARVMVNRVWLNHFGAGLVRTPSDFGLRSDPPTHPELLNFLAATFMENGWSLKKLHKLILLSNTYQQKSDETPEYVQKDANNTLLWHMNRKRLEFEPFRDTLLAVSGKIDLRQGGQPVDITTRPFPTRRTVYSFIERQNLPGIFRTFDFASPDTTSPQRFNTTVPQQALYMINSPFLLEQARSLAQRPEIRQAHGRTAKVKALYETALQREPSAEELTLAEKFVRAQDEIPVPEPPVEVWKYGYGEVSAGSFKLTGFKPLPHYTGKAWQGSDKVPDDKLG